MTALFGWSHAEPGDPDWALGVCSSVDPELFFPEPGDGGTGEARAICNGRPGRQTAPCPIRDECLDYAVRHGIEFGVWGGVNQTERRRLTVQRRRAVACADTARSGNGEEAA